MSPPRQGTNGTARAARRHLIDRPGQQIHYRDIAAALEVGPERVNAALSRWSLQHPEQGITRSAPGTYIYKAERVVLPPLPPMPPDGPKPGDLFEVVGSTEDGSVVVRDPVTNRLGRVVAL